MLNSLSPYLRLAHDYVTEVDKQFGPAQCVDHALHYFKAGEGHYVIDETEYELAPGMVFIIRPGVPFAFTAKPGTKLHMLNLHFDLLPQADSEAITWPYPQTGKLFVSDSPFRSPEPYLLPLQDSSGGGLPYALKLDKSTAYEQLFYLIQHWFSQQDTIGLLKSKSTFLELLVLLWSHAGQLRMPEDNPQLEEGLQKVIQYINSKLYSAISLAELAAVTGMSPSYFLKCFKRRFGLSPMKHVWRMRIEKAKLELAFSNKAIKSIAWEIGFDGLHSFYHAFARDVGMSPGAYRNSLKKNDSREDDKSSS